MKTLPDFIIAGAPKCGTTAIWNFLNEMPEVCMAKMKEPKFFTELEGEMSTKIAGDGPRTSGNFKRGFDWYAGLFDQKNDGQLLGEASTLYFCNADSAEKIHTYAPGVKLVFMLRDPVDRAYSHYWQEYKLGFDFPDFETMANIDHPRYRFYVYVSHYKVHLERYFSLFERKKILIIVLEDFKKDPAKQFGRIASFLDLPTDSVQKIDLTKTFNEQVAPNNRKLARAYTVLQQHPLLQNLPPGIRKYLGKARQRITEMNTKPVEYEKMTKEIRLQLRNLFCKDIEYVQNLLNRGDDLWLN